MARLLPADIANDFRPKVRRPTWFVYTVTASPYIVPELHRARREAEYCLWCAKNKALKGCRLPHLEKPGIQQCAVLLHLVDESRYSMVHAVVVPEHLVPSSTPNMIPDWLGILTHGLGQPLVVVVQRCVDEIRTTLLGLIYKCLEYSTCPRYAY